MENQNEIVLKINRDEIYFSCKGYSEEFINAISDVINQRRQSLIESSSVVKLEESSNAGEIDNKKTETVGASGIDTNKKEKIKESNSVKAKLGRGKEHLRNDGSKKQGKRYHKTYEQGEKERIIEDVRNGLSFEEINKKYNIGKATYYRIKKNIAGRVKHRTVGFSPTFVSEEDKLKIAEDIKLGLLSSQILKKYHINIHAYAEIKKSLGINLKPKAKDGMIMKFGYPDCYEKTRITKEEFNAPLNSIKVDIDNIQEKICERPVSLSANPEVREWQKDMIARGL